jgi:hypothetical protein
MLDKLNGINKELYTKNIFIESHYELNISLFIRDLNESVIKESYEKLLNEHVRCIERGLPPSFNILDKIDARDYLIHFLNKYSKK